MTDKIEQFRECIELMQRDVAEFEAKYQGRFAEAPHVGIRRGASLLILV